MKPRITAARCCRPGWSESWCLLCVPRFSSKARQEKKDTNSNDNLLINFRIAKLNSEIAITKDEKEKQRLEEELNNLKHS